MLYGFVRSLSAMLTIILMTGGGSDSLAQPVSIFGNAVPNNSVETDYRAVTAGVKFWSTQPGAISAIRFYRGATSPQGYVATLYSATGIQLSVVNMSQESGAVPG